MFEVSLLGPLAIQGPVMLGAADLGGAKPRQVFTLLALHLGRPVHKDQLADLLWDERPPGGCIATLESYVCLLRRKMSSAGRHGAIATSHGGYLLDPQHVRVDIDDVRRLLVGDASSVLTALDRIQGELLVDEPYASWAEEARTTFAHELAEACTRAARTANESGEHVAAIRLATEATRRSIFSEPAVRELMWALVEVGDRPAALQAYEDLRARLSTQLGLDVGAETRALFVRALQDGRAAEESCELAEAAALVHLLRDTLATNPAVMLGVPGLVELTQALQDLSAAC